MNKIHTFSISFLAVLAMASCEKENNVIVESPEAIVEGEYVTLSVSTDTDATKAATSSVTDAAKNTLQVFIFTSDGVLETNKRVSGSTLAINSRLGAKHIWAVVNAPAISATSEDDLKAQTVSLSSVTATNLLMAGMASETIDANSDRVDISVDRLVAKISLENVSVDFTGTGLSGKTFIVKDLYLKNVAGSTNVAGTAAMSAITWYNQLKHVPGAPAIVEDMGLSTTINSGGGDTGTQALNKTWFTCPNSASESAAGQESTWSPRHTRLVLHATVGGTDTYYTFTLPALSRNHAYTIKTIKITMQGKDNDNNDETTNSGALNMDITVNPWTGEDEITYEY